MWQQHAAKQRCQQHAAVTYSPTGMWRSYHIQRGRRASSVTTLTGNVLSCAMCVVHRQPPSATHTRTWDEEEQQECPGLHAMRGQWSERTNPHRTRNTTTDRESCCPLSRIHYSSTCTSAQERTSKLLSPSTLLPRGLDTANTNERARVCWILRSGTNNEMLLCAVWSVVM